MPLRIGIIGTGVAANHLHWPALRKLDDKFEIVALANRTPRRAEAFARLTGGHPRITSDYHELLSWPEVQAVDLALPIALNAPVTIEALQAGKHVIVEKPIAGTLDEARAVVRETARHPELVLLVAENARYEPRYREAKRLLQEGCIGTMVMIHADVLAPLSPDSEIASASWRLHPEHIGGYLSDGGVHRTAALHLLAGRVSLVQGMVTSFHPERAPTDTLLANLQFVSGAVGHLTYSVGVHRREPAPVRIYGTDGSLIVHYDRLVLSNDDGEDELVVPSTATAFDLEFSDFYEAVARGRPPEVSAQDALDDLEVIDAVLRSAREAQVIRLR